MGKLLKAALLALFLLQVASLQPEETREEADIVEKLRKPISVKFENASLRDVLAKIADAAQVNIAFNEQAIDLSKAPQVNVSLKNVPAGEVLEAVLRSFDLGYEIRKYIVWVDSLEDVAGTPASKICVEVYSPKFRTAQELEGIVKALLSPQGRVAVDKTRNLLVIKDTKSSLKKIMQVLEKID